MTKLHHLVHFGGYAKMDTRFTEFGFLYNLDILYPDFSKTGFNLSTNPAAERTGYVPLAYNRQAVF